MSGSWRHPGRSGAIVYTVAASIVGGLLTMISRLQIERQRGRQRAAAALPDGAVIVVANHTSYADGLLLALLARRMGRSLRMLATAGVFRIPLIGRLARSVGFIPVRRDSSNPAVALEPALDALAMGEAIGLLPAGRITRGPDQWPERAKTGVVRLAVRSGAPVVPVAMVGAHRVIARRRLLSRTMLNVLLRPQVSVRVGEPVDVAAMLDVAELDDADRIRAVTDTVMAEVVDLVAQVRREAAPDPIGVERVD